MQRFVLLLFILLMVSRDLCLANKASSDTSTSLGTRDGTHSDAGTEDGTHSDAGTKDGTHSDAGTEDGTHSDAGTEDGTHTDEGHETENGDSGDHGQAAPITTLPIVSWKWHHVTTPYLVALWILVSWLCKLSELHLLCYRGHICFHSQKLLSSFCNEFFKL